MNPIAVGISPNITKLVITRKTGVRDIRGTTRDNGDILIAFMYNIHDTVSTGIARLKKNQKLLSNLGIGINNSNNKTKGAAYKNRANIMT